MEYISRNKPTAMSAVKVLSGGERDEFKDEESSGRY